MQDLLLLAFGWHNEAILQTPGLPAVWESKHAEDDDQPTWPDAKQVHTVCDERLQTVKA